MNLPDPGSRESIKTFCFEVLERISLKFGTSEEAELLKNTAENLIESVDENEPAVCLPHVQVCQLLATLGELLNFRENRDQVVVDAARLAAARDYFQKADDRHSQRCLRACEIAGIATGKRPKIDSRALFVKWLLALRTIENSPAIRRLDPQEKRGRLAAMKRLLAERLRRFNGIQSAEAYTKHLKDGRRVCIQTAILKGIEPQRARAPYKGTLPSVKE